MRPGPRTLRALLALAATSLLAALVPLLVWPILAAVLAVLVLLVAERRLLGSVAVTCDEPPVFVVSLDEEEQIAFRLATNSSRALRLTVRRVWPKLVAQASETLTGVCRPGETLPLTCSVRGIQRGTAALDGPHLALSYWGWAERLVSLPPRSEIKVLPNLRAVRRLHQKLNDVFLRGLGQRTAPRLGKGREFDRLREYTVNDDFRDIAWKASARHRKLIVREYRLDRSQDVLLCIDRGHRMAALTTRIRRVDHAVNAGVLISYICNRMEDRVGMLSFGAQVDNGIPQGRGASHLSKITAFSSSIQAEYIHTDYLALGAHVRRRLRRRALVLIVTTLPETGDEQALVRAVGMMVPTHLPLVVVLSDPALRAAAQSEPADHGELCRSLVARDLWTDRRRMMEELRRRGAWVIDTGPEDAGIESVNAYLEIKRRQLI
ncbi:MAG TPA: DUF58 domain-containing protein [Planctomycetota bacterium]|nr:DUF58 domain-containing protein [Planctomycetota bacterium]